MPDSPNNNRFAEAMPDLIAALEADHKARMGIGATGKRSSFEEILAYAKKSHATLEASIPKDIFETTTIKLVTPHLKKHTELLNIANDLALEGPKQKVAFEKILSMANGALDGAQHHDAKNFLGMKLQDSSVILDNLHKEHCHTLEGLKNKPSIDHEPPSYIDHAYVNVEEKEAGFLTRTLRSHQQWMAERSPTARVGFAVGGVVLGSIISIVGSKYLWDAVTGFKQEVRKNSTEEGPKQMFVDQKQIPTANRIILAAAGGLTTAAGLAVMYAGAPSGFIHRS